VKRIKAHLLVLPLGRDEPRLGLGSTTQWHDLLVTGVPLDRRSVRIVVLVGVLCVLKSSDDVEFGVGESSVLVEEFVGNGGPTSSKEDENGELQLRKVEEEPREVRDSPGIGIFDCRQEPVELVSLRGSHNLLSVLVVSDVRKVVVPVGRDVSDSVGGLRESERERGEREGRKKR